MRDKKTQAKPDKAALALLGMGEVPHQQKKYTKADLKRKCKMRINPKGKANIEEVQSLLAKRSI